VTGVALIGTGRWAGQIAAAARRAGLRLVTCFSRDADRRAAFAAQAGCAAAASFEAAIEHPDVRGVLLVTPNDVHAEQAVACAQRGLHVFVEKPIADRVAGAERMRDACARAGVTLAVGHAFRRLGAARRAQELVAGGALGQVVLAEANMSLPGSFPPGAWRARRERNRGGPLMQLGIHHIDTLSAWLGRPRAVAGDFAHLAAGADIDDVGVAVLRFSSGALGAVTGSYVSPKTCSIRLLGTEAVLDYRVDFSVWPQAERMDAASTLLLDGAAVDFEARDMLAEELEEFGRCMDGQERPETGAAEGIAALAAVSDALAHAAVGHEDVRWARVSP
jgi:predicted dehydrogenase